MIARTSRIRVSLVEAQREHAKLDRGLGVFDDLLVTAPAAPRRVWDELIAIFAALAQRA